ncbi:MAG: mechanosensitive ion channel, partial [Muribaculaceae bacterium]|nr:mechanosensitive ion channel [Muribaculaceae bacterium]
RIVIILLILLVAYAADFVCRRVVIVIIKRVTAATRATWDDHLLNDKLLGSVCHLVPPIVIYLLIPLAFHEMPTTLGYINKLCWLYIIVMVARVFTTFLSSLYIVSSQHENLKNHPLKGLFQMLKLVVVAIATIIAISIMIDVNPLKILTGLGAAATVLMLVFKDTILGLVAGVQLSANDMLHPGDWIVIPSRNANGVVLDVSLTTVKVQNWDKTIITIPPYALISDSFQNWRGMQESGGRRVMRSINIDMNSVGFCSPEEIDYFKSQGWLDASTESTARVVNLHVFCRHLEQYLSSHPDVNSEMLLMIRQLQPTQHGLPIELYFFTNGTAWTYYEAVQAEVFDYVIAVARSFNLRIFQSPSGLDISEGVMSK